MASPLVLLELNSITWKQPAPRWWDEARLWEIMGECVQAAGWWRDFRFESNRGVEKFCSIDSFEAAWLDPAQWRAGNRTFSVESGSGALSQFLAVNVSESGLALKLGISFDIPGSWRETWIRQVIAGVTCLHASLAARAWFGPSLYLTVEGMQYPRPRPPRHDPQFGSKVLIDFFSLPYHEMFNRQRLEDILALQDHPLPEGAPFGAPKGALEGALDGVEETVIDGLLILSWIDDLVDEERIRERLSLRESWLSPRLHSPVAPFFNAQGDREVIALGIARHPNLTFYDPQSAVGYQAVYVDADGNIDAEKLAEVRQYLKKKQLPDGSPLKELYLIAPDRQRALAIAAQIQGITAVYYPDEHGQWYNPFPPGLWLTRSE